jgi:hypothetical protein
VTELEAMAEAVRQLYHFIITELDPYPAPVQDYRTGHAVQVAAVAAVGSDNLEREA